MWFLLPNRGKQIYRFELCGFTHAWIFFSKYTVGPPYPQVRMHGFNHLWTKSSVVDLQLGICGMHRANCMHCSAALCRGLQHPRILVSMRVLWPVLNFEGWLGSQKLYVGFYLRGGEPLRPHIVLGSTVHTKNSPSVPCLEWNRPVLIQKFFPSLSQSWYLKTQ